MDSSKLANLTKLNNHIDEQVEEFVKATSNQRAYIIESQIKQDLSLFAAHEIETLLMSCIKGMSHDVARMIVDKFNIEVAYEKGNTTNPLHDQMILRLRLIEKSTGKIIE